LGGATLEALEASAAAGETPRLDESSPAQLSQFEFGRLQAALGAGEPPELKGPALEGAIPFLNDHFISEYIRLLKEVRDARHS
jgi:hypothetical protein